MILSLATVIYMGKERKVKNQRCKGILFKKGEGGLFVSFF